MPRLVYPIGYHVTYGTYGTRLHGDERGTVDHSENRYGDPIVGTAEAWQQMEVSHLRFPPRLLSVEQRIAVQELVPQACIRGGWTHIATAAAADHVHQFIRAPVDGVDVRKWLKRWVSQGMSTRWPLLPEQVWWAECGSVKWVWTDDYAERVTKYIERQRTPQP